MFCLFNNPTQLFHNPLCLSVFPIVGHPCSSDRGLRRGVEAPAQTCHLPACVLTSPEPPFLQMQEERSLPTVKRAHPSPEQTVLPPQAELSLGGIGSARGRASLSPCTQGSPVPAPHRWSSLGMWAEMLCHPVSSPVCQLQSGVTEAKAGHRQGRESPGPRVTTRRRAAPFLGTTHVFHEHERNVWDVEPLDFKSCLYSSSRCLNQRSSGVSPRETHGRRDQTRARSSFS